MTKKKTKSIAAIVVVGTDTGYNAGYYHSSEGEPDIEAAERICKNILRYTYRFKTEFNHYTFYLDTFSYDDCGRRPPQTELVGIEDTDLGDDAARKKCLEMLLNDDGKMYDVVFVKEYQSSELKKL